MKQGQQTEEEPALVSRLLDLLKVQVRANPYGWDGVFAREIQELPAGLRAMAATHHLDVSLTVDDIGWHFLNFGHPSHVEETEQGLRELGLSEVAAMFHEAYAVVEPHLARIRASGADYYVTMKGAGQMQRIVELTARARAVIGEHGIYRHWAAYARRHPERVFGAEPKAPPKRRPKRPPGRSHSTHQDKP
jgi:hypothetical protein